MPSPRVPSTEGFAVSHADGRAVPLANSQIRKLGARVRLTACLAATLAALTAAPTLAQALKPSWNCLPASTVAAIHMPNFRAYYEALRTQTRFGAVVMDAQRMEKAMALARQGGEKELAELRQQLGQYNLKLEDGFLLANGDLGYAVAWEGRTAQEPLLVGLAWLEPGEDLATRLMAALQKLVQEQGEQAGIRRTDLKLVDHQVLQLTIGNSATVLVTRIGGRLVAAHNFPMTVGPPGAPATTEQTVAAFARFLASHTGSDSGHAASVLAAPGIGQVLPTGLVAVEGFADPRGLLAKANEFGPEVAKILQTIGVDRVGPMAFRSTLDKGVARMVMAASIPAPRNGVMNFFDQEPLPGEVPDWVAQSITGYSHVSFDLGKAYNKIKELATAESPAQAAFVINLAEAQVQGNLQTDVATLLSSFGQRHAIVQLPMQLSPAAGGPGLEFGGITQRMAFVWQVKDEALWKKIIQLAKTAAPATQGIVTPSEEQGFDGVRAKQDQLEGGLFLGRGFLVLGIGDGTVETVLAMLKNPPTAGQSLRGSGLAQRAAALLPPQPSMAFQLTDSQANLESTRQMLVSLLKAFGEAPPGSIGPGNLPAQELLKQIETLIPTDEELKGVMGVSVGRMLVTPQGVIFESAQELPR